MAGCCLCREDEINRSYALEIKEMKEHHGKVGLAILRCPFTPYQPT